MRQQQQQQQYSQNAVVVVAVFWMQRRTYIHCMYDEMRCVYGFRFGNSFLWILLVRFCVSFIHSLAIGKRVLCAIIVIYPWHSALGRNVDGIYLLASGLVISQVFLTVYILLHTVCEKYVFRIRIILQEKR